MQTLIAGTDDAIVRGAELLRAGELVAFPTETVYGLGADARSDAAVQKIYAAKGRPPGNPLIVHVADIAGAQHAAAGGGGGGWSDTAETLARKFWPGPLTLILPRGPHITPAVSAGRATVALRCPAHPVAQQLLRQFAGPIAAPSANRSGFTSPTTAQHVYAELAGRIPLIIDGGASAIGLESTVLDLTPGVPTVLRPGAITVEMLEKVLGRVATITAVVAEEHAAASPGQHARHYAPRTPAYRMEAGHWPNAQLWIRAHSPVALFTTVDDVALPAPHETFRLPAEDDAYARVLYAALRDADERGLKAILVVMPRYPGGLWPAIADRLNRATVLAPIPEL